ncbi:MFS transporter [bacterium]|nr:MFS transporter [bacterium]
MNTDNTTAAADATVDSSFFGHPKGLSILFFTEMWERFSYYGMRALLIFYLTQHFLFSDQRSALIYGAYTALVYVTPVIGGMLADRYLGSRKAVTFGAILLVLGHFGMAFEGEPAKASLQAADGASYSVVTDGRGSDSETFVEYGGERYRVKGIPAGISIDAVERPEGVPAVIPAAAYGGSLALMEPGATGQEAIEHLGAEYLLVRSGNDSNQLRVIAGDAVLPGFYTPTSGVRLIGAENADGLPAFLASGSYQQVAERDNFYVSIFYLSLALIIGGVGFLKANISTIVGALYGPEDPRRDGGFTIFYMGINLGSFIAVLLCGYLGQVYGWKYGFGLAGLGMLAGLVVFLWGQKFLEGRAEPPNPAALKEKVFGPINREWLVYLGGIVMVLVSWLLVMNEGFVGDLLNAAGMIIMALIIGLSLFVFGRPADGRNPRAEITLFIAGVVIMAVPVLIKMAGTLGVDVSAVPALIASWPLALGAILIGVVIVLDVIKIPAVDRDRMLLALFLILLQLPFWALFEQAGSSLNLFTDRAVDRMIGGFEVPASWFQSLNALFIFTLAPVFAWLWVTLARKGLEPNTVAKFGLGILQVGLGFLVLVQGIKMTGADGLTPMIFVALLYLLHTTGELCLSPVGLSMVTKLAVPKVVGMMMGAWFLASGFGNYIAGAIAATTGAETVGGEILDLTAAKANYADVYTNVAMVAIVIAAVVLVLSPWLKRLGHGRAE